MKRRRKRREISLDDLERAANLRLRPTKRRRWLVVNNTIQVRLFLPRHGGGWVSRTLRSVRDIGPVSEYLLRRRAELAGQAP